MSDPLQIEALPRKQSGTSAARSLRQQGQIPAILYGGNSQAQAITLNAHKLTQYVQRPGFMTTLIAIKLNGETIRAIPRQTQLHPLNGKILHMDFLRLAADSRIDVEVGVVFINEALSPGLKRGGVLNIVRHEVELSCPAEAIPDEITANLEGLDIGDSIHISHITLPDKVNPTITDRDFTIATIAAPAAVRSEETEETQAEEEAQEESKTQEQDDKKTSD